MTKTEKHLTLC